MNDSRLNALVRSVRETSSRRRFLGGASATVLALAAARVSSDVEAKKKKRKKKVRADAVCPGPTDDAFGIIDEGSRLAATFTAKRSGKLVRAELLLSEPAGSLGDYILRISPVDGAGNPTNIVLAESALLDIEVPTGQSTVSFSFGSPASVQAGTDYALVVTRPGSDKLVWNGQNGNPCTGTSFISPSQNAAFIAVGAIDFAFKTFVKS
jgi:hypothetical protein